MAKEIILVDDGSSDGTRDALAALGLVRSGDEVDVPANDGSVNHVRLIVHERNSGKGAAIRSGFAAATGEIFLIQDADLEYDPTDYPKLLQPILDGKADVVFGSRFTGSPRRVLFYWHAVGNKLLTGLSNMFTNLNLTDMETCYKVFRAEMIRGLPLRSNRFGIEPELTAKMARMKARIYEVPISYAGRSYTEGKKIGWKDGLSAVWVIVKYAFVDDLENTNSGYTTLNRMELLRRYNAWLWTKVKPFLGRHVLEVGAGTGNMTRHLAGLAPEVVATEIEPHYLRILDRLFGDDPHVRVLRLDLAQALPTELGGPFDTVICLNVLEHVEDDTAALRRLRDVLQPGGTLVLIVPAMSKLFGEIDRSIGHFRRYDSKDLRCKLQDAGLTVSHWEWFNTIGVFGWFLNSRLLRRKSVPGFQARLNDLLVPLLRFEGRLQPRWGMSLLVAVQRSDTLRQVG